MRNKRVNAGGGDKKSKLSSHEIYQLRLWTKATPSQRLAWLEEAIKLAYKTRVIK